MKYIAAIFLAYWVSWTAAYAIVMSGDRIDFSYYLQYLVLAWTFNGLERPTFAMFISIALFVPLVTLGLWMIKKTDGRKT